MAVAEMRRACGAAAIISLRPLVSVRWQGAYANGSCSCRVPPNFEHSPDRGEYADLAAASVAECLRAGKPDRSVGRRPGLRIFCCATTLRGSCTAKRPVRLKTRA